MSCATEVQTSPRIEAHLGHESMIKLDSVRTSSLNSCQWKTHAGTFGFKLKPKQAQPQNAFGMKN